MRRCLTKTIKAVRLDANLQVRIGGGVYPDHIKEADYLTAQGGYTTGPDASKTMLNSLMYKLSYWEFDKIATESGKPPGWDRVRLPSC